MSDDYSSIQEEIESNHIKMEALLTDEITTEEEIEKIKDTLPENYQDIVDEVREDPEYLYLKNMPEELINSTKEFNYSMYVKIRAMTKAKPIAEPYFATDELKQIEFLKCKYDIVYFAENHVRIPTVAGVSRFLINDKLRTVLRLAEASVMNMFTTSRQSSKTMKDTVIQLWYFNFWSRSKSTLVNTAVAENKKNLRVILSLFETLPPFLNTFDESHPDAISNVFEKVSPTKSEITTGVVDKQDPASSLRGKTSSIFIDEAAYLFGIEDAYPAIAFIYSMYGKMAKATFTPAPFNIISTPNAINTSSGAWYNEMWTNAYEVDYEEIKDLLPFEIQSYFRKLHVVITKVEQYWYEFPNRGRRTDINTEEFRKQYHHILMNIDTPIADIYEIDPLLGNWLQETRAVSKKLSNIKKDIYCMFLNGSSSAIFEESVLDDLLGSVRQPKQIIPVPNLAGKNNLVKMYIDKLEYGEAYTNYFTVFDIAYSLNGDAVSGIILDKRNMKIVASIKFKPGKIRTIAPILKWFVMDIFEGELSYSVERNSFGAAVIEDLEEIPDMKSRLYYEPSTSKYDKVHDNFAKITFGITTTKANRPIAIADFIDYVLERKTEMLDKELVSEINGLIDKNGRVEAAQGLHDDSVMSLSLTLYILIHRPELVKIVSMTSMHKRNTYAKVIDLNTNSKSSSVITKEMIKDEKYKHYDKQFEHLKNQKTNFASLISKMNS